MPISDFVCVRRCLVHHNGLLRPGYTARRVCHHQAAVPLTYLSASPIVTVSRLKPKNYDISLFDLELGGSWSYKGTVKIEATVVKPTKEIVLNTNDISVGEVEIQAADGLSQLAANKDSVLLANVSLATLL